MHWLTRSGSIKGIVLSKGCFRILAVLYGLMIAGCASYSGIAPEARRLDPASLKGNPAGADYATWPRDDWWRDLNDPVLSDLIEKALLDSPNLQAAAARLNRANAYSGQAESALSPRVDLSSSNNHQRFSERGLVPPPYAGTVQDINDLTLNGTWELDFFGKNRENLSASLGEQQATVVELQATRVLLSTNVARSYYNLARLLAQREVSEQRRRQRIELATLVERRFKSGLDTRVELEVAQGVVSENARDTESLDEQVSVARHALAALIGQGPEAVNTVTPSLPAGVPLAIPASLPAGLLGHRADVTAARWRVESALHGLESSKAQFYPNINLRLFSGFSAIGFDHWLDAGSRTPGIGLAISLPIFDAGRLRNVYRVSAATVDSTVAVYNGTLLDALRDVADQLSTLQSLASQRSRQQAALASAERSYELALRRYRAGISDRLNVLTVETNLIVQRHTTVELQARWIDSHIRLIRALGGGFDEMTPTPTTQVSITDVDQN